MWPRWPWACRELCQATDIDSDTATVAAAAANARAVAIVPAAH